MSEKKIYTFTNDIDAVEVSAIAAHTEISSYDEDCITVEYDNPLDKPEFCAVLCGKRLTLKETPTFKLFGTRLDGNYSITVHLPRKKFYEIKIKTASNGAETTGIEAENFILNTASGSVVINGIFDNIKAKSASGDVKICGTAENTAKHLDIASASGNITTDQRAEEFSISSASGNIEYNNAAGKGNISVTSGHISVDYAEWTDDLKISAVSGKITAYLPEDSGADIEFDGVSGLVKTDLGSRSGDLLNLGKGTRGQFGGSNVHKVSVNLVSGTALILQKKNGVEETAESAETNENTASDEPAAASETKEML